VRAFAGEEPWAAIDRELVAGRISLRDALARQARLVRLSRDEVLTFLERTVTVDPAFAAFVARARQAAAEVVVLSSGVRPIIVAALERAGVRDIPVVANEVDFSLDGWTLTFGDPVENGTDKAGRVRAAKARGEATVMVGDGISDYAAALAADRVFAKKNRALERYGSERGLPWTPFASFAEVERALFG
jgi:HAD superfamily phosphoserine phosphatase-like hydrolase